jgi:ADP-ribosylglycohydrolase
VNHTPERAGRLTAAYQPSRLGSIEELPIALGFALINDGEFRTSIEDGINSGRDTDSIGVMAGAILGAMHGEGVIDAADRATLDSANRMDLTASADRFTDVATAILRADRDRREAAEQARDLLLAAAPAASLATH